MSEIKVEKRGLFLSVIVKLSYLIFDDYFMPPFIVKNKGVKLACLNVLFTS